MYVAILHLTWSLTLVMHVTGSLYTMLAHVNLWSLCVTMHAILIVIIWYASTASTPI